MEEGTAIAFLTTEAGCSDLTDALSCSGDGDEMQESELFLGLELMEECQTELDHDSQGEISSSGLDDENTISGTQRIEPSPATAPTDPVPRRLPVNTGFEMDEDDYEALRLSLEVPRRSARSVNRKQSSTAIPSPATPGTQIAQEAQVADRHLASPIQFRPRHLPRSCNTSPTEAPNVSQRLPRKPRKRAYQLLEQETASILGGWSPHKDKLTSDMSGMSDRAKKLKLANKSSSNPKQKRAQSGIQSTVSTATWTVAPKARLEVVLQPKQKSMLAAYEDVDGTGKSATEQPRRGGHHGRGRRKALPTASRQATKRVGKKAAVVSKNTSSGRPKNATRRVIGGRVGIIGTRRSERTNAGNLGSANNTTTSGGVEPMKKAAVEPGSRRGRPSGPSRRRGRPPTRARVSNRRK